MGTVKWGKRGEEKKGNGGKERRERREGESEKSTEKGKGGEEKRIYLLIQAHGCSSLFTPSLSL